MKLLISDSKGNIFPHPALEAAGMEAGNFFRLNSEHFIKLPPGSQLFMLPDRVPVGRDGVSGRLIYLKECFPVAAFTPPGYTVTYNSAYTETGKSRPLPLFSYGGVATHKGSIYTTAVLVDKDKRHDTRFADAAIIKNNARSIKKALPGNRLVPHLERCALSYGCPNAQNFFMKRYEGPLPTSPSCNARCCGCISYQYKKGCVATQPRIKFIPTPEEISGIALFHINNAGDPIVSFGQGCEGEPLLSGAVIEKAIKLIRRETDKGIVNMNTNASRPSVLSRLFDAGLDSIRVSMNSCREKYYTRYYKPVKYSFKDVMRSIETAKDKKIFVSLNYLTMPGFTDSVKEFNALEKFIAKYRIDMIQWRNLNYDPLLYFRGLRLETSKKDIAGITNIIQKLQKDFPHLRMGYFNPTPSSMRRHSPKRRD